MSAEHAQKAIEPMVAAYTRVMFQAIGNGIITIQQASPEHSLDMHLWGDSTEAMSEIRIASVAADRFGNRC